MRSASARSPRAWTPRPCSRRRCSRVWQVAPRFKPDGRPDALLRLAIRIGRNLAVSELDARGSTPSRSRNSRRRRRPASIAPLRRIAPAIPFSVRRSWSATDVSPRSRRAHSALASRAAGASATSCSPSAWDAAQHLSPEHHARAAPDRRVPPPTRDRPGPGLRVTSRESLVEAAVTGWRAPRRIRHDPAPSGLGRPRRGGTERSLREPRSRPARPGGARCRRPHDDRSGRAGPDPPRGYRRRRT